MANKVLEILKKIPNTYYNWKKRNEALSKFLERCDETQASLKKIDTSVTNLTNSVQQVQAQVGVIEERVDQINSRVEAIGQGTKIELFETLHNWRVKLVYQKHWASAEEKRDVVELYTIYHDHLNGNGQGEHYYNEIMALPESEEELELRRKQENEKV